MLHMPPFLHTVEISWCLSTNIQAVLSLSKWPLCKALDQDSEKPKFNSLCHCHVSFKTSGMATLDLLLPVYKTEITTFLLQKVAVNKYI